MGGVFSGSPCDEYKDRIQGKYLQHEQKFEELKRSLDVIKQYQSVEVKTDSVKDAKEELSQCEEYQRQFQRHQQVDMPNLQAIGQEVVTARYDQGDGSEVWVFGEPDVIRQREEPLLAELRALEARFSVKFQELTEELKRAEEREEFREHERRHGSIVQDLEALRASMIKPEDIQSNEERDEELKVADEIDKELRAQEARIQELVSIRKLSQHKPGWSKLPAEVWEATAFRTLSVCSTVLHQKRQRLKQWKEPPVRIINLSYKIRLSNTQNGDISARFQRKNPAPRPVRDEFSVLKPLQVPKTLEKQYEKLIESYPAVTPESEIRNQAYKDFIAATQATAPTPADRAFTEKEVRKAEANDEPRDIAIAGLAQLFATGDVDFVLTEDPTLSNLKNLMVIGNVQATATKVVSVFTPEGLFGMSFDDFQKDILAQKRLELEVRTLAANAFKAPISEIAVLSFARGSEVMRFGCPKEIITVEGMDTFTRDFLKKFQLAHLHVETTNIQQTLTLSNQDFDSLGDFEFPEGGDLQERGGCDYFQPAAPWKRVGLRVIDCYENNDWLGMDEEPGAWAVGFHGSTKAGVRGISRSRSFLTNGDGQVHEDSVDINPQSENKNKLCGVGAYFARKIDISADDYTEPVKLGNGKLYSFVFQCRLHPKKMRQPEPQPDFLIVNEAQYVRPYGICYKECKS